MTTADYASGESQRAAERPRVGLVVVDDGLYTHRWVSAVLDASDIDVVCVACLNPFEAVNFNPGGARGLWPATRARLAYYGIDATVHFAAHAAAARLSDVAFRLRLGGKPNSVASAVRAHRARAYRVRKGDINDAAFRHRLASCRPDLLVCAFSQRADETFLSIPRLGCLNVHFSLLPHHRGREPSFRAMLGGQGAGVSVHWMTPELDTGAVVCQGPLDATRFQTLDQLILSACDLAVQIVPQAIRAAMAGRPAENSASILPPLLGWPTQADLRAFRERGFRFV